MFADTIIASFFPTGAVSSLYYADRLYQLPVGVIGIAAGTVLLPEMSRRLAGGDAAGAHRAQNRAFGLTLALAAPFAVAFLAIPDLITAALFKRGAFDAAAEFVGDHRFGGAGRPDHQDVAGREQGAERAVDQVGAFEKEVVQFLANRRKFAQCLGHRGWRGSKNWRADEI